MKKIGIVGGIAWPSTVDYYVALHKKRDKWYLEEKISGEGESLEISIESLDLNKAVSYLGNDDNEGSWTRFDAYHRAALERLAAGGAEFAVIASNTPHHRFATIASGVQIPVIDLFDEVAKKSAKWGAREVMVLGTVQTMKSQRFRTAFESYGVKVLEVPREARTMVGRLIADLQRGTVNGAANKLDEIVRLACGRILSKRNPLVCLACTELPLAFLHAEMPAIFEHNGFTYLNSSAVHIDAAFDFAVGK